MIKLTYIPPRKYRPRYFSPLGWVAVTVACFAVVIYFVGLAWVGGAFYSLLK
jgi:hypothetical protein